MTKVRNKYYCVIKNCNIESIKDFNSFTWSLPDNIKFFSDLQRDKAINKAKLIASHKDNNESFIVSLELNQLPAKELATVEKGPSISVRLLPEHTIDHWDIAKLTRCRRGGCIIEIVKSKKVLAGLTPAKWSRS